MATNFRLGQVSDADRHLIVRTVAPLLAAYSAKLCLFGSRARGEAGARSDIDLATKAAAPLPAAELARIREKLEEAPIPFRVDVIDYQSASSELKRAIEREGIEWIG